MTNAQKIQTMKLEEHFIRAALPSGSFNKSNRTFTAVISTGARAVRYDFESNEMFIEELEVSPEAVNITRLNNGAAPVLINHEMHGPMFGTKMESGVAGVVESARVEGGQVIASARLSKRASISEIVEDVEDGILRNISIGYRVSKYEDRGFDEATGYKIRVAVDWEIFEMSLVSVPVDDKAQVRSDKNGSQKHEAIIVKNAEEEKKMGVQTRNEDKPAGETQVDPSVDKDETQKDETQKEDESKEDEEKEKEGEEESEEKESSEEKDSEEKEEKEPEEKKEVLPESESSDESRLIVGLCKRAGLSNDFAVSLIQEGLSLADANKRILEKWEKKGTRAVSNIQVGAEKQDILQRGISNAILHRSNPKEVELTKEGREFANLNLREMAEECLNSMGIKTRGLGSYGIAQLALSRETRFRAGYHVTADFPNILQDAANKKLRLAYMANPQTFRPWVSESTASDFKTVNRPQLSEGPAFVNLSEGQKIEYRTIGDSKEAYALASYGVGLVVSRETIINDDLSAFTRIPAQFGFNASRLESDIVYGILIANANMADSNPLFDDTNHGNLDSSGAVINETSLNAARAAGQKQTGPDGQILDVMFQYLIAPSALFATGQKQLGMVNPNSASDFNPFQGVFQLITEPRLDVGISRLGLAGDAQAWYMAANPASIDTIEVLTLQGVDGVRIDTEIDFDSKGIKMNALHDFAAKALDWRGLYKNVGA